ncbi:MAG: hypothetical protein JW768_02065 [Chitinispirillaceae bacterium]|nr:hypothetical protein [Chitinispirillaceae bacterium]
MTQKAVVLGIFAWMFACGSASDTITILPGWWKTSFEYNGERLQSYEDFRFLLVWSPEASAALKKSRPMYLASRITMTAGLSLVGISLVQALYAGLSNVRHHWQIGAAGAGVVLASLPLYLMHDRKLRKAAAAFNRTAAPRPSVPE